MCFSHLILAAASLVLAERGRPPTVSVVVSDDCGPTTRYAADELSGHVQKMTGVRLPVVQTCRGARVSIREVSDKALGTDGFRLRAQGGDLVVEGGRRGVLYGVYELLETYGGCGWFSSGTAVVPERDSFAVPSDLNVEQRPAFKIRELYWYDTKDPDFAARLRLNDNFHRPLARHGGNEYRFAKGFPKCHSFRLIVPPEKYFDAHPEYFSEVDGKRIREWSQLCLTNPDVLDIATRKVLEAIEKDPDATYFGVSQNDWQGYCTCAKCKAIDDEEGSHSGTIIRFVNAIADEVAKKHPGKTIETLAYQYSRKPPRKTRPRDNVMVCLCSLECDFSTPIADGSSENNALMKQDLLEWSKMTDRLYVWDYTTNFKCYVQPFPNLEVLQPNLKLFRDSGVVRIMEQGAYQGAHADFAELKAWVLAKLMWNPDQPAEPLVERFLSGYYGKAAPFVRKYLDELQKLQRDRSKSGGVLEIFEPVDASVCDADFLERSAKTWREAEKAVAYDALRSYNVRMSSLPTLFMLVMSRSREIEAGGRPADAQSLAKALRAAMAASRRPVELAENPKDVKEQMRRISLAAEAGGHSQGLRIAQLCLARQMETPSFCSNYIDRVAALGYNAIQLYVTARVDTPTFALPQRERYSADEMRGIVSHAIEAGMDVIPYVEIFGHADLFFKHPGLDHLAEELKGKPRLPGGKLQTFCFSSPETKGFLRSYLRDLAAIFPGRNVNVGMDEVWNGGICPDCRAKDARGDLFYEGIMFFHDELAKLGKRMWMWDDFFAYHPGTLERIPRDIMMCHWDYDGNVSDRGSRVGFAGRPRVDDLANYERLGFDAIACCWNCPGNPESLSAYARRHKTAGFMVTTWPEMQTSFPSGWLPVNAAVSLLLDQPEKYAAADPYPDAIRMLMPSLTEQETLAAASLFGKGPRELAVSVLRASRLHRPDADVADDPFSEQAMLDDIFCRAEAELLKDRIARIEGIPADLRRTAADVKAAKAEASRIAADIRRVAARRRAQAAKWRPGCDPAVADKKCQELESRLDRILSLPEAPAAADEKFLELVLVRPDWHGWALWNVQGRFGDEWRVLADGQWGPGREWAVYTKRFPFKADAMPTELRIEYHGYGRGQMAFAAVDDGRRRVVPDKVLAVSGPVEHPERLLSDDLDWADFGTCGFLDKFHFRSDPNETSSVTLSLRPGR